MTPRAVPTTPRIVVTPSPRDPGNGASASPEDQEDQPPVPGHARRWITTTSVPAGLAERVEARRTELTATLRRVFDVAGFRALQLEAVVAMVDVSAIISTARLLAPGPVPSRGPSPSPYVATSGLRPCSEVRTCAPPNPPPSPIP